MNHHFYWRAFKELELLVFPEEKKKLIVALLVVSERIP